MVTNQDSNWTLFYARSSRDPNRFYKIAVYQDRCYCCECPANRIRRQECRHIKAAKAGELAPVAPRQREPLPVQRPTVRRVTVTEAMRDQLSQYDL